MKSRCDDLEGTVQLHMGRRLDASFEATDELDNLRGLIPARLLQAGSCLSCLCHYYGELTPLRRIQATVPAILDV
jgi:hypothetical protein